MNKTQCVGDGGNGWELPIRASGKKTKTVLDTPKHGSNVRTPPPNAAQGYSDWSTPSAFDQCSCGVSFSTVSVFHTPPSTRTMSDSELVSTLDCDRHSSRLSNRKVEREKVDVAMKQCDAEQAKLQWKFEAKDGSFSIDSEKK
jgi:hypothetical protein